MADKSPSAAWDAEYPSVSYSESQDRRRRQCARSHYHSVFTAHRGWKAEAQTDSWRAYRAKKAVPLSAAVGTVVHDAATRCVDAIKKGQALPSFDDLRSTAAASLNERWRNSRRRIDAFLRAPTRVPVFLEALYGDGPNRSALFRANQTLEQALTGLLQCATVWEWVRSAAVADVVVMDPFTSFHVTTPHGTTTCFGAADLVVRPDANGPWHIVDFKTGSADGVIDQILTYAIAVRDALGLSLTDGCIGAVVALAERPENAVSVFAISEDDITDAVERLQDNIGQVRALLVNQSTGEPRPMEEFAQTAKSRTCSWCAFRVLCHPELVNELAPIAADGTRQTAAA